VVGRVYSGARAGGCLERSVDWWRGSCSSFIPPWDAWNLAEVACVDLNSTPMHTPPRVERRGQKAEAKPGAPVWWKGGQKESLSEVCIVCWVHRQLLLHRSPPIKFRNSDLNDISISLYGSAASIYLPIQLGLQLGPIRATWLIESAN
jgi:hypothetical protein